ncbi:MAG: YlmC/YmxH family sporulation protein [Clostridia bacterium]|nr:YlmC/YmxH family sporulation protein [Clostridia bacterium]
MTYSDLRRKDIICVGDGRFLGRVTDLELDAHTGQIRALIIGGGCGLSSVFHGEKNQTALAFQQIACIGDDVILVSAGCC